MLTVKVDPSLGFDELVNLADANPISRDEIALIMRQKFKISEKEIRITYYDDNTKFNDDNQTIIAKTIFHKFLRTFGDLVTNLRFDVAMLRPDAMRNRYINLYCSKTLKRFTFGMFDVHIPDEWDQPFEQVVDLTIYPSYDRIGFTLNKMFPKVQKLDIQWCVRRSQFARFEQHQPNLLELSVYDDCFWDIRDQWTGHLERFFGLNPQLQKVTISNPNSQTVKVLNENLLDLTDLTIKNYFNNKNETFHFEKVNKFRFIYDDTTIIKTPDDIPFSFNYLEEIFFTWRDSYNKTIDFILQHKELKKLHLLIHGDLRERLMDIAHGLPNLDEVTFYSDVINFKIVEFIAASRHLKKITVNSDYTDLDLLEKMKHIGWELISTEETAENPRTCCIRQYYLIFEHIASKSRTTEVCRCPSAQN